MSQKETDEISLLLGASTILMLFSLFLPAIKDASGLEVLVKGLPIGWSFPPAWAVYANVFYLVALIRYKQQPVISTGIAVFLASLTFVNNFTIWKWGAVVWLIAILLLALAVFLQPKNLTRKIEALILLGVLSLTFVPVFYIHVKQMNVASALEKEKYLPFGTAFTTEPLTGLEKKSPPRNLDFKIDNNAVIEVIGMINSERTKVRDGDFSIEIPSAYQNGRFVQVFRDKKSYAVTLLSPTKPVDYYYGIKKLEENLAEIFILDKDKKPLWKANVKYITNDKKSTHSRWRYGAKRLYPDYYYDLDTIILHDYSRKVVKIDLKTESYYVGQRVLTAEKASGTCSFTIVNNVRFKPKLIKWNEQLIEIDSNYGELQNRAFCSENYTFLLTRHKLRNTHKMKMHVLVFDKSTMRPMYGFKAYGDDEDVSIRHLLTHSENFDSIQNIAFIPNQKNVESARITLFMANDETITLDRDQRF